MTPRSAQSGTKPKSARQFLFDRAEWDFATLQRVYEAIEEIALNDLGLSVYPNQIEIISSDQMLDAYCSIGMPLMYSHWSFGKHFAREESLYRKGHQGLAYEIVINSSPCISYCMEENTMPMQTLVIAHAAFGHNHFFKNNYLFKDWTDAGAILGYLEFAKGYIAECEQRHGGVAVEAVLDAAHALMDQSVFRSRRAAKLSSLERERRIGERRRQDEQSYNDLWRTLPASRAGAPPSETEQDLAERKKSLSLPEENLLYFIEKHSPSLQPWQREILRIVRNIAQYFYPQKQTKLMNEGCATFVHHHIANRLFDDGLISEGALLEILHSHSNVVLQPGFDDRRYGGINPYALGFAMMRDIQRICTAPAPEDREWFPEIAGNGDWRSTLKDIWANYRDESFVRQFLSPRVMREFRLFALDDRAEAPKMRVDAIHDEDGYRRVRSVLADTYDVALREPDIQIVDVDLKGDRELLLRHTMRGGVPLASKDAAQVIGHIASLWGYRVRLDSVEQGSGTRQSTITSGQ